jgi:hypothetical protein
VVFVGFTAMSHITSSLRPKPIWVRRVAQGYPRRATGLGFPSGFSGAWANRRHTSTVSVLPRMRPPKFPHNLWNPKARLSSMNGCSSHSKLWRQRLQHLLHAYFQS